MQILRDFNDWWNCVFASHFYEKIEAQQSCWIYIIYYNMWKLNNIINTGMEPDLLMDEVKLVNSEGLGDYLNRLK